MAKALEKRLKWGHLRHRYFHANKAKRAQLLDELCDLTHMNRKYLIRKLNKKPGQSQGKPGPEPTYPPERYLPILKKIWFVADQPCSKKMVTILPHWLPFYEQEYGKLEKSIHEGLLKISAATIDRLLNPIRSQHKAHGLSGTKPGTLIKNQIPIRTNQWEEDRVGFLEADTVAHCGNSLNGDFIWSLTLTDIVTGWTENRATWNKGAHGVGEQIDDVESVLPFKMRGFDCDNGSEFLNYHLLDKFTNRPKRNRIVFTRSRPYKKNDNAHVEQKNWTHVRHLFGYHRLDQPHLVAKMNDLYRNEWSLFQNHFIPNMKCIEKVRVASKYKKKFDRPQTPYERTLQREDVPQYRKAKLRRTHKKLNPFELKRSIEEKLKAIFSEAQINDKPRTKL